MGGDDAGREESGAFLAAHPVDHAARIESSIEQAIRNGLFDDLPGAGKPLRGLNNVRDPDWWIRQKIEDENLSGLGPTAFALRAEDAALRDRLDEKFRESDVRELVEDFNRRIVEARRQLQGGPPVVTPTRDVQAEVDEWRQRRAARARPSGPSDVREEPRESWRERRRAQRAARRTG